MISWDRVLVVALRVVRQLKRDRRTIGMITLAPVFLMVLFGYALSGEMSGVRLGIVDVGADGEVRDHLTSVKDFEILHLGSESDAEKMISEGRLSGAVVMGQTFMRVLLDASSPQVAGLITSEAGAALQKAGDAKENTREGLLLSPASPGSYMEMEQQILPARPVMEIRYVYGYDLEMMDSVGPAVLGLVVFFFTFLMAAISFLRERTLGTLEKFMVSPLTRLEMIAGYLAGFSLFSLIQSATTLLVVIFVFGVPMRGSVLTAFLVILLLGGAALTLGSLLSNFARSEFQVVQFIPVVILPQTVLSGVWWPVQSIPASVRPISYLLPLTYSSDALRQVMLKGASIGDIIYPDLAFLAGFFIITLAAAIAMLNRKVG